MLYSADDPSAPVRAGSSEQAIIAMPDNAAHLSNGVIPPAPPFADMVATIRRAAPATIAVYAYGSCARGQPRPDSDVDLGVVLPPGQHLPAATRIELGAELARLAHRAVDVVELDLGRSVVLCKEVVATGSVLFAADGAAIARFEMAALGAYARLNEDRQAVLAAYGVASRG
jgi:uncharacterized protein